MTTPCHYFNENKCKACSYIDLDYQKSIDKKTNDLQELFSGHELLPMEKSQNGFGQRTKAKYACASQNGVLAFGTYSRDFTFTELEQCPLHHHNITRILPAIKDYLITSKINCYDPHSRKGELKYLIIEFSQYTQDYCIRFVLRSEEAHSRLQKHIEFLVNKINFKILVSLNIQPLHAAIMSGSKEIILTHKKKIDVKWGDFLVEISPQSFIQTNEYMAKKLYDYVKDEIIKCKAKNVLDLFCGNGAFSFATYQEDINYTAIELNPFAIESANNAKIKYQITNIEFLTMDAFEYLNTSHKKFDLIIVNPPRRGLGPDLCKTLYTLKPKYIIYSSCNPLTQKTDIDNLAPHYQINNIKGFDMFPYSTHLENVVSLVLKEI